MEIALLTIAGIAGIAIATTVVVVIATVWIINKIVKSNPFWKK